MACWTVRYPLTQSESGIATEFPPTTRADEDSGQMHTWDVNIILELLGESVAGMKSNSSGRLTVASIRCQGDAVYLSRATADDRMPQ